MREAGKVREAARYGFDVETDRARGGEGESGVLAVMRAAQVWRDAKVSAAPLRL